MTPEEYSFEEVFKNVQIEVVNDASCAKCLLDRMLRNEDDADGVKVIGLDCEWTETGNKRNPVALLQLAYVTPSGGLCVLLRLCKSEDLQTMPELQQLLNDKSIVKVGVAIAEDAAKLKTDYNLTVNGCVDLRQLAKTCLSEEDFERIRGLSSLCETVLNYRMEKNPNITCSDWNSVRLTPKQERYAAIDAYVGPEISYKLVERKLPQKIRGDYEERNAVLLDLCEGLKDTTRSKEITNRNITAKVRPTRQTLSSDHARISPNSKRDRVISGGKCFVCDREGVAFRRKYVVPYEYQRYFPWNFGPDNVKLLCADCHQTSSKNDSVLRQEFAKKYIQAVQPSQCKKKVKKAANALLYYNKKQSPDKLKMVAEYLQVNIHDVNEERLVELADMDIESETHARLVMEQVRKEEDGYKRFEAIWWNNFMEKMKPSSTLI